ncbi:hypothetical protein [Streptomyces sp. NPDC055189]
MPHISFDPEGSRDIPAGARRAWEAGRIDLAALSATDLRYGYFECTVVFKVAEQELLAGAGTPLVDIMFTLAYSLKTLHSGGAADIDFTENTYVIHVELAGDRVRFTPSYNAGPVAPECLLADYEVAVRSFVTSGITWLVQQYPAIERNPALGRLRELAGL